jgi:hypothetical protein
MSHRSIAQLYYRTIVTIAVGLIVLQAFLAGLAVARAALALADPLGAAVICHRGASGNTDDGTPPEPIKAIHLCCYACIAGSPTATLPEQVVLPGFELCRGSTRRGACASDVRIAARAIRAGQSQAPPWRG